LKGTLLILVATKPRLGDKMAGPKFESGARQDTLLFFDMSRFFLKD